MNTFVRQTVAGNPTSAADNSSVDSFWPLGGFSPTGSELLAHPGSLISGQNTWVRYGVLEPRWKLSSQTIQDIKNILALSNVTNPQNPGQRCLGVVPFISPSNIGGITWVSGSSCSLALSCFDLNTSTISWYPFLGRPGPAAPSAPSYASATTFVAPSLRTDANWRGAVVLDAATGQNLLVLAANTAFILPSEALMATDGNWAGASNNSQFVSRLSGATPKAVDVVNFADRIVAWNCDGIHQRVQWHSEGDPTDWVGIGSGFQDLADMQGYGTRIFTLEDEMVLASTEEIWRGRLVGLPYIFNFTPINRTLGMPYERATLQTPHGIFWLGRDFTIYQMQGESIRNLTQIGQYIQAYLRDNLKAPETAFFTYNSVLNQIRMFYSIADNSYPTRSISYDIDDQIWTDEGYAHAFHCGISTPMVYASAITGTSSKLDATPHPVGIYAAQVTSAGTFGSFSMSATSDLGVACDEQAVLAPINGDNANRRQTLLEARYDIGAKSASSLTVSWSLDFGDTHSVSQVLSVASSSNASQIITYPSLSGQYFTPHIQSTSASWQLRRVTTKSRDDGEMR